jgi:hypothetical protein
MRFVHAGITLVLAVSTVSAHTIDRPTTLRGRFTDAGNVLHSNYSGGFGATIEYRPFFVFALPLLSGVNITGARLELDSHTISGGTSAGFNVVFTSTSVGSSSLTSASTSTFHELGTGTLFGSRIYQNADTGTRRTIELNAAALDAISSTLGSEFVISARVIRREATSQHTVFGSSTTSSYVRLFIDYEDAPPPPPPPPIIPLPTPSALAAAGMMLVLGRRRR